MNENYSRIPVPLVSGLVPGPGLWKVVWHGHFDLSVSNRPNINVEVVLSKVDSLNSISTSHSENFVVKEINASYLRLIAIGSVWQQSTRDNGTISSECIYYPNQNIQHFDVEFEASPRFINLKNDKEQVHSQYGVNLRNYIPKKYYNLGSRYDTDCLALEYNGDPAGILLPCTTLLATEFGDSNMLIQCVLGNWLKQAPERVIKESKTTTPSIDGNYADTPILYLSNNFSKNIKAIKTLGAMYFDPAAGRRASLAHQSLTQSRNPVTGKGKLQLAPMHVGKASFTATGFWVEIKAAGMDTRKRFVVTSIKRWEVPLPFSDFEWDCDIDNRPGQIGPEGLQPTEFPRRRDIAPESAEDAIDLKTDTPTSSDKRTRITNTIFVEKPYLDAISIDRTPKDQVNYKNDGSRDLPPHDDTSGSDGDQISDSDAPPEVLLEDYSATEYDAELSTRLQLFVNAINCMQSTISRSKLLNPKSIAIDSISIAKNTAIVELDDIQFPIVLNRVATSLDGDKCDFGYMPDFTGRNYIAIELCIDESTFFIIDSDAEDESISSWIVANKRFQSLRPSQIKQLHYCLCRHGPTLFPSTMLTQFQRKRVLHVDNDAPEKYAKRLLKQIIAMLNPKRDENSVQIDNNTMS